MLELARICKNNVTEKTKNAFLCIELVDEKRESEFQNALKELAELTQKNLGSSYEIFALYS